MFAVTRYFTESEARALCGRRIRTLRLWSGMPIGTTGRIIDLDVSSTGKGWRIAIEWDLAAKTVPMIGWFTRDGYEQELEALPM